MFAIPTEGNFPILELSCHQHHPEPSPFYIHPLTHLNRHVTPINHSQYPAITQLPLRPTLLRNTSTTTSRSSSSSSPSPSLSSLTITTTTTTCTLLSLHNSPQHANLPNQTTDTFQARTRHPHFRQCNTSRATPSRSRTPGTENEVIPNRRTHIPPPTPPPPLQTRGQSHSLPALPEIFANQNVP